MANEMHLRDHALRPGGAAAAASESPLAVECRHVTKYFYVRPGSDDDDRAAGAHTPAGAGDGEPPPADRTLWDAVKGRLIRPARRVAAVSNVSFSVRRGEIFGIIGPNGSGKSTLVRLLSTLLIPDHGSIRIFGHDVVTEQLTVRRLINRVSVEAAFFKKLSALENLSYAARLYDLPVRQARQQAVEILSRLGLPRSKLSVPLEELSRGMQQKVAVARALFTSPVLLLLDEPTTGLDPRSKREVQVFIRQLHEQHDATVLLTSHDMQEIERLCGRVGFIKDGKLIVQGTVEELKALLPGGVGDLEELFFRLTGSEWKPEDEEVGSHE